MAGAVEWARADRGRRLAAIATAVGLSAVYLIFVAHFSTNVPIADDWSVVLIGHDALTGHLSFGLLWTQHLESRMLVVNAIFVLFAWADHLNLRSVVLTSGIFLVVSYGLLLVVFRAYSRRPLTALVVLATWGRVAQSGRRGQCTLGLSARLVRCAPLVHAHGLSTHGVEASPFARRLPSCGRCKCSVVLDGARASSLADRGTAHPLVDTLDQENRPRTWHLDNGCVHHLRHVPDRVQLPRGYRAMPVPQWVHRRIRRHSPCKRSHLCPAARG